MRIPCGGAGDEWLSGSVPGLAAKPTPFLGGLPDVGVGAGPTIFSAKATTSSLDIPSAELCSFQNLRMKLSSWVSRTGSPFGLSAS
eukprot:COSAG04_NODE_45_length_31617_cov_47.863284_15_plen_86_part_00